MSVFLSVLLMILKVIGIILLVILGLVLLVLALILFCPFRYKADGVLKKEIKESAGKGEASWLWGAAGGGAWYEDKALTIYLKIFGFRKVLSVKSFEKKDEPVEEEFSYEEELMALMDEEDAFSEHPATDPVQTGVSTPSAPVEEIKEAPKPKTDTTQKEAAEADISKEDTTETDISKKDTTETDTTETESSENKPRHSISEIISDILTKLTGKAVTFSEAMEKKIDAFGQKFDALSEKLDEVMELISDEQNQAAVKHVLREVFYILGSLLPKTLDLNLDYSMGSPDTTGMVYGVIAALPYGYRRRWGLRMDLDAEKFYVDGTVCIRGRILLCLVIGALLRLLFDRNVWHIIKLVLKKRKG